VLGVEHVSAWSEVLARLRMDDRVEVVKAVGAAIDRGLTREVEVTVADEEGDVVTIARLAARPVATAAGPGGGGALVCVHDITDSVRLRDEVRRRATYDALTGCHNRASVIHEIERLLAEVPPGEHVGVAYVDLDDFKPVNDRLGHAAGDELLCQVAHRLRACARRHDLVGRLGGDEFVVVFADLPGVESLARLVDRLHREVNEPTVVDGTEIMVRASIGAVAAPRGSDADMVLAAADEAMGEAKRGQYATPCLRTSLPPERAA